MGDTETKRAGKGTYVAEPTWQERPWERWEGCNEPGIKPGVSGAENLKAIQGSWDQHSEWRRKEADPPAGL